MLRNTIIQHKIKFDRKGLLPRHCSIFPHWTNYFVNWNQVVISLKRRPHRSNRSPAIKKITETEPRLRPCGDFGQEVGPEHHHQRKPTNNTHTLLNTCLHFFQLLSVIDLSPLKIFIALWTLALNSKLIKTL